MSAAEKWWSTWAPYWEHMEDRHFKVGTLDKLMAAVSSPVLVVGAGSGLLVEHLRARGHATDGIDLDETMCVKAKRQRGIDIAHGDALALPYEDDSYGTVLIASGVADYADDAAIVGAMVDEAIRVLRIHGNLFVGFYQLHPVVEHVNRKLGVVKDGIFHMKRMFQVQQMAKGNPLTAAGVIAGWTSKNLIRAMAYWTRLGAFLPRELRVDSRQIEKVVEIAAKDGVTWEQLYAVVPERIPYRGEAEVNRLMTDIGHVHHELRRFDDCLVVRYTKSTIGQSLGALRREERTGVDDWYVRTENLSKRYASAQRNAVDGINIGVGRGEIFGILGPNGAGKTTTLSMLCGLLEPDGGSIEFAPDIDRRRIRQSIGYVPQDLALQPRLTALENLVFYGRLYKVTGERLRNKCDELLRMVGLHDRATDRVNTFSSGMMRRLNLAAGLIHEPQILLLDEPTVGIDPQSRNCIFEAVLELKRKGVTIFYTTHYMEEASKLCDRIAIMDHGRVILEGNPRMVVERFGLFTIEFHVDRESDELREAVSGLESVVSAAMDGHTLSVLTRTDTRNKELIEEVFDIACRAKLELSLRRILEPNLESLFLDVTGKSLKDGSGGHSSEEAW